VSEQYGYVKLFRGDKTLELLKDPHAWTLLSVIAIRARRTSDFGISGLQQAEADGGGQAAQD